MGVFVQVAPRPHGLLYSPLEPPNDSAPTGPWIVLGKPVHSGFDIGRTLIFRHCGFSQCTFIALRISFSMRLWPTRGVQRAPAFLRTQNVRPGTYAARPHLIPPRLPSRPRLTGEQFDLRQGGIHALDDLVSFIGLAAVLTTRGVDDRRRARSFRWAAHVAARADHEQLVLIENPRPKSVRMLY